MAQNVNISDDHDNQIYEEEIVWQGQPNLLQSVLRRACRQIGIAVFLFLAILIYYHLQPSSAGDGTIPFLIYDGAVLMFVSFVLLAIYEAKNTFYTITRNHVTIKMAIIGGTARSDIPIDNLRNVNMVDFGNGYGTISLGKARASNKLHCINNPKQALQLLVSSDVRDLIKDKPIVPLEWDIDPFVSKLENDEHYLWLGKPDPAELTKQRRRSDLIGYRIAVFVGAFCAIVVLLLCGWLLMLVTVGFIAAMSLIILFYISRASNTTARDITESVCYAVTNQRIMVYMQRAPSVLCTTMIPLNEIEVGISDKRDKFSTIEFNARIDAVKIDKVGGGDADAIMTHRILYDMARGFFYIRDAENVLKIIQDAQDKFSGLLVPNRTDSPGSSC